MFNNLKLAAKISFGFAVILAILLTLGGAAIYNLLQIQKNSQKLSAEYMPEVDVAVDIQSSVMQTMYAMRAYAYSDDKEFFNKGMEHIKETEKFLDKADDLAKKSPHLLKLHETLPKIRDEVSEYKAFAGQTEQITRVLDTQREAMDKAATEYIEGLNKLLGEESRSLEQLLGGKTAAVDLKERLWKITKLNDTIDLGNSVRILNFKAQALREPELTKKSLGLFADIYKTLDEVLAKTAEAQMKAEIVAVQKAGKSYETALQSFYDNWSKREAVGKDRGKTGDMIINQTHDLASAGIKTTLDLTNESNATSTASVMVLVFGLAISLIIGILAAIIIIRNITVPIRGATNKLTQSNVIITDIAQQLSAASQQLSAAATEQASFVEETSSSLEELAGMVENNVSNAQRAVELSAKVKQISEVGNSSMQQLKESMNEILSSNERIERLVKLIENIAEKTQVMDEIVFQTKLLSFNASVEAERAGEHGRGFAVVAQEVGNLAQMSGKSAQEIAEIVRTSIKDAETITRENREKVQSGNRFVAETSKILSEITDASRTMEEGSQQVLSASQDQAKGIKQINVAMTEIDKSTQQNASTSEETASSSEELASQVGAMAEIVADVTKLVEGVQGAETQRLQQAHMMQRTPLQHYRTGKTSPAAAKVHLHAGVPNLDEHRAKRSKLATAAAGPLTGKKAVGAPEVNRPSADGSTSDEWESL
jgi:methyl-accepting chemotaxis protein